MDSLWKNKRSNTKTANQKFGQKLSNNISLTDKQYHFRMCQRIGDVKTYFFISEEEVNNQLHKYKTILKRLWKAISIKTIVQKKRLNFYNHKCIYTIFHTFIQFGKSSKPWS